MNSRTLNYIFFLLIIFLILYSWFEIVTTQNVATWRHYLALTLLLINAVLYFLKYKRAVMLTGIILILATFNLLSFFTIIHTSSVRIGPVTTPEIHGISLLLLMIYLGINLSALSNWYLDWKEKSAGKAE